ncbi:MAG TPA: hypothetical protein DCR14_02610, partial [Acidimicrobiaceae bacterium]|nr:hypothetical protein [Acidimicrobiaceae bacterium]
METALARLSTTVDDVAGIVLCGLDRSLLTTVVVELQVVIDRLTLIHAQVVTEADRAGVWAGSGARSMADWLAQQTNTSWRDAQDRVALGDAADTCPALAAAVGSGELSAKSALELADAVREGVGDTAELVDAVKGSNPRAARAASNKWRDT